MASKKLTGEAWSERQMAELAHPRKKAGVKKPAKKVAKKKGR